MLYTDIIERVAELGGIDCIGVPSEAQPTAICFSGENFSRKYGDGTRKISIIMQVSKYADNDCQKQLVGDLCDIGKRLAAMKPVIDGIQQPRITIANPPVPKLHTERGWIYSMFLEMTFYTKELI